MSIDERLRSGLPHHTEVAVPDLERVLAATYDRVRRRQRVRRGTLGLVAAAFLAVAAWSIDLRGLSEDADPIVPLPTPIDLDGVRGPLDPGTYSMAVWGDRKGDPLPRVVVDVPAGFFSNGGFVIDAGHDVLEPQEFGVVHVWLVQKVLADPCRRSTATKIGPGVTDLARALASQPGATTSPRPVELDGHRGVYLEVTVPTTEATNRCRGGEYPLWRTDGAGYQGHSDPGVVHHLWILDVDGTRLALVASTYPDQPAGQEQELIDMAESLHFVDPVP